VEVVDGEGPRTERLDQTAEVARGHVGQVGPHPGRIGRDAGGVRLPAREPGIAGEGGDGPGEPVDRRLVDIGGEEEPPGE
jgi:hypothetical protein